MLIVDQKHTHYMSIFQRAYRDSETRKTNQAISLLVFELLVDNMKPEGSLRPHRQTDWSLAIIDDK